MSDGPTPETDAVRDNVFDIWGGWSDNAAKKLLKHARRLERERDEAREESAKWHQMSIEADTRFVEVMRERDQYKGLLIRLYNDLFVHHKGEAVRDFKALFREENYN